LYSSIPNYDKGTEKFPLFIKKHSKNARGWEFKIQNSKFKTIHPHTQALRAGSAFLECREAIHTLTLPESPTSPIPKAIPTKKVGYV
jgi:hypothetical protein